jgi:integrating conjugative element protein (TIGR03761 family)
LFAGRQQEGDEAGSKEYSINNLKKFAIKMNPIWFAARDNDPFADWLLYLIEQKLEEVSNLMSAEIAKLEGLLDCFGLLKSMSAYSTEPVEVALSFANPFSYRAAFLIGQYDKLACMAFAAFNVGLAGREIRAAAINAPARRIRRLFMMATVWKPSGVHAGKLRPRHGGHPEGGKRPWVSCPRRF